MRQGRLNGWRDDLEDREAIARMAGEDRIMALHRYGYREQTFDPRAKLRKEDQQQVGACSGFSMTSTGELCGLYNGATLQFSEMWSYTRAQIYDKLIGRDSGATIDSVVRGAMEIGFIPDDLWRFKGRYEDKPPNGDERELREIAGKYRIRSKNRMDSYDGIRTFLGSGQGGIEIGIGWNDSCNRAVIEQFDDGGGGGHALMFACLSERKDRDGRPYIWMMNSWGAQWGNDGWAEVSPRAIEQMLRSRMTVMIGCSDLSTPRPRELTREEYTDGFLDRGERTIATRIGRAVRELLS